MCIYIHQYIHIIMKTFVHNHINRFALYNRFPAARGRSGCARACSRVLGPSARLLGAPQDRLGSVQEPLWSALGGAQEPLWRDRVERQGPAHHAFC